MSEKQVLTDAEGNSWTLEPMPEEPSLLEEILTPFFDLIIPFGDDK